MAPSFDDITTSPSRAAVTTTPTTTTTTTKSQKPTPPPTQPLLPGLPDHIAPLCLSLLPPTTLFSVSRSWRRLLYSGDPFPAYLSLYTLSSDHTSALQLSSFDPISSRWTAVPPPSAAHLRRVCLRHPSFISRNLSIQSVSVAGSLILLAGTSSDLLPALPRPIVFDPLSKIWSFGPPPSAPRRWCAAVVLASGFGSHYAQAVARSVEKWVFQENESFDGKGKDSKWVFRENEYFDGKDEDSNWGFQENESFNGKRKDSKWVFQENENFDGKSEDSKWVFQENESLDGKRKDSKWVWKKMRSLRDGKLSREAIDAVGCKGKLYMVNVNKEGFVYDVNSDGWSEMPAGMLGGWRGPAAAMDEETMYVVDESEGVLRKYDDEMGVWVDVLANGMLKGAERIAAGGGRVCMVRRGGVGILVVDVVASPPRLWVVDTLVGHRVLALHILPRMCPPEFQSVAVV